MLIKNEFEVAESVEKVWRFFDNIPQVAACLPGAELTENLGDDKYKGKVAIRMGPVRMQFAGTADITERDDAAKRIVPDVATEIAGVRQARARAEESLRARLAREAQKAEAACSRAEVWEAFAPPSNRVRANSMRSRRHAESPATKKARLG